MKEILDAAYGILKRADISAEEIAIQAYGVDENGKPRKSHWTLYKELNPNDTTAKLGAVDLFRLMAVTGDVKPLEIMAKRLGYILVPESGIQPDCDTWQEEHVQDTCDEGDLMKLMASGADPVEVQARSRLYIKNIMETVISYGDNYNKAQSGKHKE